MDFVLIAVHRSHAQNNNWKIVTQHPLAKGEYEILDYAKGFEAIDWPLIAKRDYTDRACKVACMAECLSPKTVPADQFFSIYVKTEQVKQTVSDLAQQHKVSCHINLNSGMFAGV